MRNLYNKKGYLPMVFLTLALACIGISCEEENTSGEEALSQKFLSRDVEIDW